MKFKNLPIRKKMTRTHAAMIVIPALVAVFLSAIILLGVSTGILLGLLPERSFVVSAAVCAAVVFVVVLVGALLARRLSRSVLASVEQWKKEAARSDSAASDNIADSEPETGARQTNCVELGACLEDLCEGMQPLMQKNGIELVFENQCTAPLFVETERAELGPLLRSLAQNSIRLKKIDERVRSRANVVLDEVNNTARFVFSDNGVGLGEQGPENDLLMARLLVARMGGKLAAQGTPGLGLAVTVLLPQTEESVRA